MANWLLEVNLRLSMALLGIALQIKDSMGVRCFCTDEQCTPFGMCEADWCLVGIDKRTNSVIRSCGRAEAGGIAGRCLRNFADRWESICACKGEYCNTFTFLREQIKAYGFVDGDRGDGGGSRRLHPLMGKPSVNTQQRQHSVSSTSVQRQHNQPINTRQKQLYGSRTVAQHPGDSLVFQRVDEAVDYDYMARDFVNAPLSTQTSMLTLCLVVIPLTVGAAAVFVVATNYYCHLC